jgi:subtilisin family serine protease
LGDTGDYIGGVAYGARLYAVKISTGDSGRAWISDMIEGWEWCITHQDDDPDNPIMIISTSFGGFRFLEVCDEASVAMTQAAANAVAAGMTLFASSGNDGFCDSLSWPACISHVISVGAVFDANIGGWGFCVDPVSCAPNQEHHPLCNPDRVAWAYTTQGDQETPYSNKASFLDLFAPSHFTYTTDAGGGYNATFGGTSAASPYAAGAAACLQSAAKALTGSFLSPNDVRLKLSESGDLITEIKGDIIKPRVNLGAAVGSIGPPVIDDISFDECVSELRTSNIMVTAYDPQGGELAYDWEALDGGEIVGEGAGVLFDPPDTAPHPCPYRVRVTAISSVSILSVSQSIGIYVTLAGDFDHDGDVDGSDMSTFAADFDRIDCDANEPCEGDFDYDGDVDGSDLAISAAYFGRTDGCACP